jgi:hypothetical protein
VTVREVSDSAMKCESRSENHFYKSFRPAPRPGRDVDH